MVFGFYVAKHKAQFIQVQLTIHIINIASPASNFGPLQSGYFLEIITVF